jgi:hypothetical protein
MINAMAARLYATPVWDEPDLVDAGCMSGVNQFLREEVTVHRGDHMLNKVLINPGKGKEDEQGTTTRRLYYGGWFECCRHRNVPLSVADARRSDATDGWLHSAPIVASLYCECGLWPIHHAAIWLEAGRRWYAVDAIDVDLVYCRVRLVFCYRPFDYEFLRFYPLLRSEAGNKKAPQCGAFLFCRKRRINNWQRPQRRVRRSYRPSDRSGSGTGA